MYLPHDLVTFYTQCTIGIYGLRVLVYWVNLEHVTKVKVSEEAWQDPRIRDVMDKYIKALRYFLIFRACVAIWTYCCVLDGSEARARLCLPICLLAWAMDLNMAYRILDQEKSPVFKHQHIAVPLSMQMAVTLPGLLLLWAACQLYATTS